VEPWDRGGKGGPEWPEAGDGSDLTDQVHQENQIVARSTTKRLRNSLKRISVQIKNPNAVEFGQRIKGGEKKQERATPTKGGLNIERDVGEKTSRSSRERR